MDDQDDVCWMLREKQAINLWWYLRINREVNRNVDVSRKREKKEV